MAPAFYSLPFYFKTINLNKLKIPASLLKKYTYFNKTKLMHFLLKCQHGDFLLKFGYYFCHLPN